MKEFVGNNEKTKIIVKLQKRGSGKPAREPLMSEEERKQLMLHAYRRQEQLKVSIFSHTYIDEAILIQGKVYFF